MAGGRYPYPKHVWYVRHIITEHDLILSDRTLLHFSGSFENEHPEKTIFLRKGRGGRKKKLDTWTMPMIGSTTSFNKSNSFTLHHTYHSFDKQLKGLDDFTHLNVHDLTIRTPSGGWWTQPTNWKANTAVAVGITATIVAAAWKYSAENEVRLLILYPKS